MLPFNEILVKIGEFCQYSTDANNEYENGKSI